MSDICAVAPAGFSRLKTIATVAGLVATLPFALIAVGLALAMGPFLRRRRALAPAARTVLISGAKMTKALHLARAFHRAGHRVVMIESHGYGLTGHRVSNAVDAFYTVDEADRPGYLDDLREIVERECVDVYVPVCSPASSVADAAAVDRLGTRCEVVHVDAAQIDRLDDKQVFAATAESLGLRVPRTIRVTSAEQVIAHDFASETHPMILKSLRYDALRRLDMTPLPRPTPAETRAYVESLPISPDNPWVLQEYVDGDEYCTHGLFRDGELRVHCVCASSAFQVNYAAIEAADIREWVERFGQALTLTGQASFDFIRSRADGEVYAIECNPRTHSAITLFYDHAELANAYLGGPLSQAPIEPLDSARPTYWLFHELWRALRRPRSAPARLKIVLTGKEAVFDIRDPLPFLALHYGHIPALLLRSLRQRRGWLRIDFNIGKLVQPGGD